MDAAVAAIETDRRVGEAFLREPWPPLADFLQRGGTSTLLDFIQLTPGERSPSAPPSQNPHAYSEGLLPRVCQAHAET